MNSPTGSSTREYEIYLPSTQHDGEPVDAGELARIKEILVNAFGGYTQLNHGSEGVWKTGDGPLRDEITIIRVLDNGYSDFDMTSFKKFLETKLMQQNVLIVSREIKTI